MSDDVALRTSTPGPRSLADLLGVPVGSLGFGVSGVVMPGIDEDTALACLAAAWEHGLRWFDAAPMYGDGRGEVLLGRFLADKPRDSYVLSSKVGRLLRPEAARAAGLSQAWVYDFSADGVRRSLDESLARLGTDRLDAVFVHDPEDREHQVLTETWPTVARWRDEGTVRAVGIGMQLADQMTRYVERLDLDLLLVAGRYTLVDPGAADTLLPACQRRGVRVLAAEALHAGLARGARHPHFNYRPVPGVIRERVDRIAQVCAEHGVDLEAAALQFPLTHPAVDLLLTGPETTAQLEQNLAQLTTPVPGALWQDLQARGLLPLDVPVPVV